MKELKDRTIEGLLEMFSESQISIWCEKIYGSENSERYRELKRKANNIRKEIISRVKNHE